MRQKNRIIRVWIERAIDEDGDISDLGRFTDEAEAGAFVRSTGEVLGDNSDTWPDFDGRGREFRFFVPAMSAEETGNPDSPKQDWRRAEDYGNGWSYVGVIAKAEIVVNGVCQIIRSGGLWGIESDSGDYFDEVESEQLAELREVIQSLGDGFGKTAIKRAFANVEHKN